MNGQQAVQQPQQPPPPSTKIPKISFWQALFTQSNWNGNVAVETWYGCHGPWRRVFAVLFISAWAWSVTTLVELYWFHDYNMADNGNNNHVLSIPLFHAMTSSQLKPIQDSHTACLEALCKEIGQAIPVDCVVQEDDATKAKLELMMMEESSDNGIDNNVNQYPPLLSKQHQIAFPPVCHDAVEKTLGESYLQQGSFDAMTEIKFMTLELENENQHANHPKNKTSTNHHHFSQHDDDEDPDMITDPDKKLNPSLLTLYNDCSVGVSTSPFFSEEELEQLQLANDAYDGSNSIKDEWAQWLDDVLPPDHKDKNILELTISLNLLGLSPDNSHSSSSSSSSSKSYEPGHREQYVLRKLTCPADMDEDVQDTLLPALTTLYTFVMDYRHELLAACLSLYYYVGAFTTLWLCLMRSVFPAIILHSWLEWPVSPNNNNNNNNVHNLQRPNPPPLQQPNNTPYNNQRPNITRYRVWRTLVWLSFITSYRTISPTFAIVMVLGALLYRDTTAAMEWMFLGMLAWGADEVWFPILDGVWDKVLELVVLPAIPPNTRLAFLLPWQWMSSFVWMGPGWWTLVRIYVITRSYRALWQEWSSSHETVHDYLQQTRMMVMPPSLSPPQKQTQQQQQQQQQHGAAVHHNLGNNNNNNNGVDGGAAPAGTMHRPPQRPKQEHQKVE